MSQRRSLSWPITLGTIMIVLLVALIIGWVLLTVAASPYADYWWVFLALGTTFLVLVLVGVILYLWISVKEISLNQRQANFIDSVTHELKSPIASLKLYLQTLERRNVSESQQVEFHRFMLDDLNRLDGLINHLLEAARVDQVLPDDEIADVEVSAVIEHCAETAVQRYRQPSETITRQLTPAIVRARPIDVEMIFRNLIDNALKYSLPNAAVRIEMQVTKLGRVVTRISDNGPGIPLQWRRKIFRRFVRMGSELERQRTGTGLGLYIVDTLVKRLRGKVLVRGQGAQRGTVFEVQLPGRAVEPNVFKLSANSGASTVERDAPIPAPARSDATS